MVEKSDFTENQGISFGLYQWNTVYLYCCEGLNHNVYRSCLKSTHLMMESVWWYKHIADEKLFCHDIIDIKTIANLDVVKQSDFNGHQVTSFELWQIAYGLSIFLRRVERTLMCIAAVCSPLIFWWSYTVFNSALLYNYFY